MGKVRELPDALVNKIAAGEVIERPASVVKELVENALDAGARRVQVEIRMAGSALIRVTDDGSGMEPEDAEMALRRHATSKIASFDDLETVATLGFRGEALPSIASVAEVEILTRPLERLGGTSVRAKGGKPAALTEAGAPAGTTVTVKNLFYNVPARRKFLKSHATETGHVFDVVARLALAHENVAFSLDRDGERVLTVPAGAAPLERIACVLGPTEAAALFPFEARRGAAEVRGFLSRPETTRPTAAGVYLYVNGRPVRERGMLLAVLRGYEGLVEKGRYPVGAAFLTLPPRRVDVNVHPAKTEVRFDKPREIEELLREAVREALVAQPWLRKEGAADVLPPDPSAAYKDRIRAALGDWQGRAAFAPPVREQRAFPLPEVSDFAPRETERAPAPRLAEPEAPRASPGAPLHSSGRTPFFSGLRYVGQARASYLILEGRDGLFLLDQHAAHERVTFERLRAAHEAGAVEAQRLLIPVTVDLERRAAERLFESAGDLAALGIEIADFGGGTAALTALPAILADADGERLVRDLADELLHGGGRALDERRDAVFACMACHNSVRASDALAPEHVRALLEDLDRIDFSAHCPHGRPVVFALSWGEIEKRFHRT